MSVSATLGDPRRLILGRLWRRDAAQELLTEEALGAFSTELLPEGDSELVASSPEPNNETAICRLAGMTVVEDGLPFGFHYVDQRDRPIGYAA